ncbi:MAG: response regulator [Lachnospiraceae bacterium]|nr:response regulator [Lachnospiraceae bacterium]
MNLAIVDDRQEEAAEVKAMLKKYAALYQLEMDITYFPSAEMLLKSFRPLLYTIIFMDIYMEGLTGIQAAKELRKTDSSFILIFLTTSEDHRADAFHCHAYDYLVKPVSEQALFQTIDDILRNRTETAAKRLLFSSKRRDYSIPYEELLFVRTESSGSNYLEITDSGNNTYRTRMTFSSVYNILKNDKRFLLLQSGVLVNMEHIVLLKDKCCVLDNKDLLPYAVKKEKEIRQIWQNYMFEHIRNQALNR